MSYAEYQAAVAAMSALGRVVESDWPVAETQPPYRLASLDLPCTPEQAIQRAEHVTRLAVATGAGLCLYVHKGEARWYLSAHRPLTAEEIAAALPRAERGMAEVRS